MKKIKLELTQGQANFIWGALEKARYDVYDDPSAFDIDDEDGENEDVIDEFVEENCKKVIEQIRTQL